MPGKERLAVLTGCSQRVEPLPGGYNSEVNFVIHDGDEIVIKVVGGKKAPLTQAEALELQCDIVAYHYLLAKKGIPVPDPIETWLMCREDNRYTVLIITPFAGYDVRGVFKKESEAACLRALDQILAILRIVFEGADGFDLELGLDSNPPNFCRRGRDAMNFVDLVPARFRKNGVPLVEFPQPASLDGLRLGYFKHFDIRGMLEVLLNQLSRLRPEFRPAFKSAICAIARDYPGVSEYFQESPAERFARSDLWTARKILEDLEPGQVYDLRAMACEVAAARPGLEIALEELYRASHFEDELSQECFERLRQMLSTMMAGIGFPLAK